MRYNSTREWIYVFASLLNCFKHTHYLNSRYMYLRCTRRRISTIRTCLIPSKSTFSFGSANWYWNAFCFVYVRYSSPDEAQSDIHYNRSATSPRLRLIHDDRRGRRGVATRFCSWSATRRRLIGDWFPIDRRLVGDLVGTSLRLDATGRRPVGDRSPTNCRPVADRSPTMST